MNQIFIFPVRLYQWILSPFLGRNCRFQPTCSHYMIGAIEEWGPIKGIYLGAKRIGRCHPWGGHGYDPVPVNEKRQKASKHFTITKPEADTSIHKHGEETEEK
ncbi:MAG: membrane protein insertion efficiency factor YidD [Saprospiraceae bacterium]|nr:membrane protein insertion efficiency factor YidD [Saprospiraceae bacterium]